MKKLALAAALSIVASASFAGGLEKPIEDKTVMPAEVVEAQTSSSAGAWIVPLLVVLIVAAAVASS